MRSLYSRPDKPKIGHIPRVTDFELASLPAPLPTISVGRDSECFVTPEDVSRYLVDVAAPNETTKILEPECGTGNILKSIQLKVGLQNTIGIEINSSMCNYIEARLRFKPICGDFLEVGGLEEHLGAYDLVLMNPPFRKAALHIQAAFDCLVTGGEIYAVVPSNFEKIPHEVIRNLPSGTFQSTAVATKIIYIQK